MDYETAPPNQRNPIISVIPVQTKEMRHGGGLLHSDITRRIIGCAKEVHRALGNEFQEVIYQRALAIEMAQQGLGFSREHEMPIY